MYWDAGFARRVLYFFSGESTTNHNEGYGTGKTPSANWLKKDPLV